MSNFFLELKDKKVQLSKSKKTKFPPEGTLLFLSLDLTNSTRAKSFREDWPEIVDNFMSESFSKFHPEFTFWKANGDEVLFFKLVEQKDELRSSLMLVANSVKRLNKILEKNFSRNDARSSAGPCEKNIRAKATLWITKCFRAAPIASKKKSNGIEKRTLIVDLFAPGIDGGKGPELVAYDFIGPTMDAGFRLSKYAHSCTITLHPSLARIVAKNKTHWNFEIAVVDHKQLKGVLYDSPIPIIWARRDNKALDKHNSYNELHAGGCGVQNFKWQYGKDVYKQLEDFFKEHDWPYCEEKGNKIFMKNS